MLMSLPALVHRYNMHITGVLHLGAHLAEEAATYADLGVHDVLWVEANPAVIPLIEDHIAVYPRQTVVNALVYSKPDVKLTFNVTNYDGMSSSILEFGTHPQFSPDTVFVDRLELYTATVDQLAGEGLVPKTANLLNMDLQGAELHALCGAVDFLPQVDYIMTEVNSDDVYKHCARVEQLDEFLSDFERVETYWVPDQGWGDALYVRRS